MLDRVPLDKTSSSSRSQISGSRRRISSMRCWLKLDSGEGHLQATSAILRDAIRLAQPLFGRAPLRRPRDPEQPPCVPRPPVVKYTEPSGPTSMSVQLSGWPVTSSVLSAE